MQSRFVGKNYQKNNSKKKTGFLAFKRIIEVLVKELLEFIGNKKGLFHAFTSLPIMIDHQQQLLLQPKHLQKNQVYKNVNKYEKAINSIIKRCFSKKKRALLATKTPSSSLSYTIAALNPAFCTLLTFSSKLQPPLITNANREVTFEKFSTLLLNSEHASRGSAKYNTPHSPDPSIGGAENYQPTTEEEKSQLNFQHQNLTSISHFNQT